MLEDYLNKRYSYTVISTSYLGLQPGDLIQFNYEGSLRFGLIVASRRTDDGIFLSGRLNTLLNVILLPDLSEAMFSLMVNNLYENENACKYGSRRILGVFLGKKNLRTFNVAKIKSLIKFIIEK
jgi:hypothetical protein